MELEVGLCGCLLTLLVSQLVLMQRQPGFGEASHNPFTMRMLARILREHPSGALERTYSIMVRGSVHICVGQGFLSQPAHNLQPP